VTVPSVAVDAVASAEHFATIALHAPPSHAYPSSHSLLRTHWVKQP
jgi:hypothetical protein